MKKLLLVTLILALPLISQASLTTENRDIVLLIPPTSYQQFDALEENLIDWECSVSDIVDAIDGTQAIKKMGEHCLEEVRKALSDASGKQGLIDVRVSWPGVVVREMERGYFLEGTIFLKALILR